LIYLISTQNYNLLLNKNLDKMKSLIKKSLVAGLFFALLLNACTVPGVVKSVTRPVDRQSTQWTAIGSVRTEVFSKYPNSDIPYDALLKEAQRKYGEAVDVIEIKEDVIKLDPKTKKEIAKETKKLYNYKFIYNALVVSYK
jgi:hypothetical protein